MQLAEKYRSAYPCAVVGVDVAAGEVGDDPAGHVEAFQKAKELGLKVTLHAGEVPADACSFQDLGTFLGDLGALGIYPWQATQVSN